MPLKTGGAQATGKYGRPSPSQIGACNTIVRAHDGKALRLLTPTWAALCARSRNGCPWRGRKFWYWGQAGRPGPRCLWPRVNKGRRGPDTESNSTNSAEAGPGSKSKGPFAANSWSAKTSFDVIVNATAVGMHGIKPATHPGAQRNQRSAWSFSIWSTTRWIRRCCAWLVKKELP